MAELQHDWFLHGPEEIKTYCYGLDPVFSRSEIQQLNTIVSDNQLRRGITEKNERQTIRDSDIYFLPNSDQRLHFIFRRCSDFINHVNQQFFKYDIEKIETLQYSVYGINQFYATHMDMLTYSIGSKIRKLSFTIQLSDPSEYDGGDLVLHMGSEKFLSPKDQGHIICFPSFTLHEVLPVTKGIRKSLVGWVTGPRWK